MLVCVRALDKSVVRTASHLPSRGAAKSIILYSTFIIKIHFICVWAVKLNFKKRKGFSTQAFRVKSFCFWLRLKICFIHSPNNYISCLYVRERRYDYLDPIHNICMFFLISQLTNTIRKRRQNILQHVWVHFSMSEKD